MSLPHPELLEHVIDHPVCVTAQYLVVVVLEDGADWHVVVGTEQGEVLDVQETDYVVPVALVYRNA